MSSLQSLQQQYLNCGHPISDDKYSEVYPRVRILNIELQKDQEANNQHACEPQGNTDSTRQQI